MVRRPLAATTMPQHEAVATLVPLQPEVKASLGLGPYFFALSKLHSFYDNVPDEILLIILYSRYIRLLK